MNEKLSFHFEGGLADEHKMNFYESARFQYAAARLLVKMSQFRKKGKFGKKISSKSNVAIQLVSHQDGSFNINVESTPEESSEDSYPNISLSDLVSLVAERVIDKIDLEENLPTVSEFDSSSSAVSVSQIEEFALEVISENTRLADVPRPARQSVRRRVAEITREGLLSDNSNNIERIDFATRQKLVAMSAPLIVEMGTALRKSADTVEVFSSNRGKAESILYLDQSITSQIETSVVDDTITAILCDIVQFNKDNGWGKMRIEDGALLVSFNIPFDLLPQIKQKFIDTMKDDQVYLQVYFVRDRAEEVKRLIVVGILPTPRE